MVTETEARAVSPRGRGRGRPSADADPVASREAFLDAALDVFSVLGFEGASIREIAARLEVSHGLIKQKFGSKDALWKAAVDHGMDQLVEALESTRHDMPVDTPADQVLKKIYVSFLMGLRRAPAVLRLMNLEGQDDTDRLRYILDRYRRIETFMGDAVLGDAKNAGKFRDVPSAVLFFLVAHGGGAIFSLGGLARSLGIPPAESEEDALVCAEAVADVLIYGVFNTAYRR